MDSKGNELAARCEKVGEAISLGLQWVQDNREMFGNAVGQKIKEFKKAIVASRKLRNASLRKMCVGVFGISQAGKSYLISALAQKEGEPLMAQFNDVSVDFLAKINPEGGEESTGIVTRLTIDRIPDTPPNHPIFLRLLSEIDIVKILINSYVFDIAHDTEDDAVDDAGSEQLVQEVYALIEELEGRKSAAPLGHVTEEDVYELEEYCGKPDINAKQNHNISMLRNMGFWDRVVGLLPLLQPADRARLYAPIWGRYEVFTELFVTLQQALDDLQYESEVFCSLDGLFHRDEAGELQRLSRNSIVAAGTMHLFNDPDSAAETVQVRGRKSGIEKRVSRAALTALVLEMVVVMRDRPYDFFDYTDLLDFPGARGRTPLAIRRGNQAHDKRKELVLRGKVAYLFDRYSADQELTSLLLCSGPENNDAVEHIDHMITDWVIRAHGQTPEERTTRENALFFLMTKFDTAFKESAGKENPYPARVNTSLVEPYSKRCDWLMNWTSEAVFSNCYAFRNPKMRSGDMFNYAEEEDSSSPLYYREVGVRSERVRYIEDMRDKFLESDEVARYFRDPARNWESLMAPNDGGISFLIENLRPLCNPQLKIDQVERRIETLARYIADMLEVHYVSGDIEDELAKKRGSSMKTAKSVLSCASKRRFAHLVESLQVRESDVYELCLAAKNRPHSLDLGGASTAVVSSSTEKAVSRSEKEQLQELEVIFGKTVGMLEEVDEQEAAEALPDELSTNDFATQFSIALEQHWGDRLRQLIQDEALLVYLSLDPDAVSTLTEELLLAAKRLRVFPAIAGAVRRFEQFKEEIGIWKQVETAIQHVNEYVAYLGCGGMFDRDGSTITSPDGKQHHVFSRHSEIDGYPEIGPEAPQIDKAYYMDWIYAYVYLADENVRYLLGMSDNLEENVRLGSILKTLHARAA